MRKSILYAFFIVTLLEAGFKISELSAERFGGITDLALKIWRI